MQSFKCEGIIIKRKNYSEADRIITVFTKQHGKLQIKASGVRKITSRRSPHIELLNHSFLTLHLSKGYPILTEAQSVESFSEIKSDLTKIGLAYHLCELIDGLCPEGQEQEAVFYLFKKTLEQLVKEESVAVVIHAFEVELLSQLGYWQGQAELSASLDTNSFIENIIERKLKSKGIFAKLQEMN